MLLAIIITHSHLVVFYSYYVENFVKWYHGLFFHVKNPYIKFYITTQDEYENPQ